MVSKLKIELLVNSCKSGTFWICFDSDVLSTDIIFKNEKYNFLKQPCINSTFSIETLLKEGPKISKISLFLFACVIQAILWVLQDVTGRFKCKTIWMQSDNETWLRSVFIKCNVITWMFLIPQCVYSGLTYPPVCVWTVVICSAATPY